MSYFPIILIPPSIQQAKSAHPPIPTFTEPAPQQPGAKPQKINYPLVAIEAALAVIFSAAVSSGSGGLGFLFFLAAAGAIAFQTWQQVKTYPQRKHDHQREVNDYPKKLENYNHKKRQHEEESRSSQTPERIAEFQYQSLRDVLSRTRPHDGNSSTSKTGASEAKFGNYLEGYFLDKIQTRLKVQNPSYDEGYYYTPDFAYIDRYSNLYVDIEIDEPYNQSGSPIHYVELTKQQVRDEHFLSRGWLVIRFCEEQVVRHPHSCCKIVAQAIASVLGDTSVLNQFANTPDLQPMRQWTQSEAEDMAASDYRDEYLRQPSELVNSLIEAKPQLPVISLPKTRAQSRGAARKAKRADLSTSSPNTTDPRPLPLLTNCPYCGVKIQPTKLESHKTAKCPKRPA